VYFVIAAAKAGSEAGPPALPDATVGFGAGAVFAVVGFGAGLAVAAPALAPKLKMESAMAEIVVTVMTRERVEVSFMP
jgi:hypothetical protein